MSSSAQLWALTWSQLALQKAHAQAYVHHSVFVFLWAQVALPSFKVLEGFRLLVVNVSCEFVPLSMVSSFVFSRLCVFLISYSLLVIYNKYIFQARYI